MSRKKKKAKPSRLAQCLVVVLAIVVLGTFAVVILMSTSNDTAKPALIDPDVGIKAKIRSEGTQYQRSKIQSVDWWLATRPDMSAEILSTLAERKAKILATLSKYQHVSPLAGEIAGAFGDFRMAIMKNNQLFYYIPIAEVDLPPPPTAVCYVPLDEAQRRSNGTQLHWSSDTSSVTMPACNFSEVLFAGVLFHELGHGLRHSIQGLPEQADPLHAEEEVEMHTLGSLVLNEATQGRFHKAIDGVLERNKPKNYKEAIAALTAADMASLDQILGGGSKLESGYLISEYYFTIAFRYIDKSGGGLPEKADCYRWIVSWTGK